MNIVSFRNDTTFCYICFPRKNPFMQPFKLQFVSCHTVGVYSWNHWSWGGMVEKPPWDGSKTEFYTFSHIFQKFLSKNEIQGWFSVDPPGGSTLGEAVFVRSFVRSSPLTLFVYNSGSWQYIFLKSFGDILGMFVDYFWIIPNILYVCQSVSWLTSLLILGLNIEISLVLDEVSFWNILEIYLRCSTLAPTIVKVLVYLSVC